MVARHGHSATRPGSCPFPVSLPSGRPASRYLGPVEPSARRGKRPSDAFAARCRFGQPLGELAAVACRAGDVEMAEIP